MIGERLGELRKDRGLKQKELADKLGISIHTVSSYERNLSTPDDEMKLDLSEIIQIGGHASIGCGFTKFTKLN